MTAAGPQAPAARTPSRPWTGVAFVLAAALLFAANGTVSKLALHSGVNSLELVEIRCVVAAVVLMALGALTHPSDLRIRRQDLGFLAVYGIVGVAGVQWLYFVSIDRIPVGISLLLEFMAPLLVALYVRFVRKEPVRSRVWAALALSLSGLWLVAGGVSQSSGHLDAVGLIAGLAAAGCLAVYYLLGEKALARREPIAVAAWSFTAAALFWLVLVPVWRLPFGRMHDAVAVDLAGSHFTAPLWSLVLWVCLLGTVAPFLLVLAGLRRVGATRAGLIGTAEPVLAGAVAWAVIGEALSAVQLAGSAVVLTGILLAETARQPHPADQ